MFTRCLLYDCLYLFLLFLSPLLSYIMTEKHYGSAHIYYSTRAGLNLPPPCSSFLNNCFRCVCVCVCVFWAITAWPFLPPLLPVDCDNRLRLIIHKNLERNSGSLTTLVANGSQTRACVCIFLCVFVCFHLSLSVCVCCSEHECVASGVVVFEM